jgi:hypothetical protein
MLSFPPSQLFSLIPSLTSILLSFLYERQSHPKKDRDILMCVGVYERERGRERERERERAELVCFQFRK